MTIVFAVLAVFVGDLSLYVVDLGASFMDIDRNSVGTQDSENSVETQVSYTSFAGSFLVLFNKFIVVGAVIYPVIVERYLHSSNVEAYFNSKALAPTADAGYTHRSPF
jgi:hypothetical protein